MWGQTGTSPKAHLPVWDGNHELETRRLTVAHVWFPPGPGDWLEERLLPVGRDRSLRPPVLRGLWQWDHPGVG